jgi:hypothetical protein
MLGKDNGLFLAGRKKQKSIRNIPSEPAELLLQRFNGMLLLEVGINIFI